MFGVTRAWNDLDEGVLNLSTCAATPSRRGAATSFRVTKLPDLSAVSVKLNGDDYPRWRATGDNTIEIETDVGDHEFRIVTGMHGAGQGSGAQASTLSRTGTSSVINVSRQIYSPAGIKSCSCC